MIVRRNVFDEELRELKQILLQMGGLVEKALSRSIEALKNVDVELAQQVIDGRIFLFKLLYQLFYFKR